MGLYGIWHTGAELLSKAAPHDPTAGLLRWALSSDRMCSQLRVGIMVTKLDRGNKNMLVCKSLKGDDVVARQKEVACPSQVKCNRVQKHKNFLQVATLMVSQRSTTLL